MQLKEKFSVRVQRAALSFVPFLLAIITFAFSIGAVRSSAFSSVRPEVLAISVYYWSLFYPALMPYPAVFVLGLIEDEITGGLFGISALLLVLMKYITSRWLKGLLRRGFAKIWIGAGLVLALATVIRFTSHVMQSGHLPSFAEPVLQLSFSILLYPLLHVLLSWVHGIIFRR